MKRTLSRGRHGPRLFAAICALSLGGAVLTLPTASSAAEGPAQARPATPGAAQSVTLITGDTVTVRDGAVLSVTGPGGEPVDHQTRTLGDDLFVVPLDATPFIARDQVDEELFNVAQLIASGYGDARTSDIPLLATYSGQPAARSSAPPSGGTVDRRLGSLRTTALHTPKKNAATFWKSLTTLERGRSAGAPRKLWLDAKVSASLDESVPQIGAPDAWAAGYTGKGVKVAVLDTGYDPEHPDLKGRIAESQDFTGKGSTVDGHGHGTHVASTIAGSGAASDGRQKGVAPDADLLIGKVLSDSGSGPTSSILAGMEWAVDQGADVVSMSLGSDTAGQCATPLSDAVDTLSAQSHSLFVVAAGNAGPGKSTVGAPGCARSALTVAAVDRELGTASFSGRGDVFDAPDKHYLKPDIAAPGVGIVAARAKGTSMGTPVNAFYTAANGTSMATPHVAGAAALLAQKHPDWTGERLKSTLMSSARTGSKDHPLAQGAGFVDVARATRTTLAGPGTIDGGNFPWPHSADQTADREVTWTNDGDSAVTLDLALDTFDASGTAAPGGAAALDRRSVTVPAHGTASALLRLNAGVELPDTGYGELSGRVTATAADGTTSVTAFGFQVAPHMVTMTFEATNRAGDPAGLLSYVDLLSPDRRAVTRAYFNKGRATLSVMAGVYDLDSAVYGFDPGVTESDLYQTVRSLAFFARPGQNLTEDATVRLDGRTAHRISVEGDRPLESRTSALRYRRVIGNSFYSAAASVSGAGATDVAIGESPSSGWDHTRIDYLTRAYAPMLNLSTADGHRIDAQYALASPLTTDGVTYLSRAGRARVVDVGKGTASETDDADVRGAFALLDLGPDADSVARLETAATTLKARGAVGVLVAHDYPGNWKPFNSVRMPVLGIDGEDYQRLREDAAPGGDALRWSGTPDSPYVYNLARTFTSGVPHDLAFRVHDRDLGRVLERWYGLNKKDNYSDNLAMSAGEGDAPTVALASQQVAVPSSRVAYYSTGDVGWLHLATSGVSPSGETMTSRIRREARPYTDHENWFRGPLSPQVPSDLASGTPGPLADRTADTIAVSLPLFGDADGHYAYGAVVDRPTVTLARDGVEVGRLNAVSAGSWEVAPGHARYDLSSTVQRRTDLPLLRDWALSTSTTTRWSFDSDTVDEATSLPLLMPSYQAPLDTQNRAPRLKHFTVVLGATGQPGYDAEATSMSAEVSYDDGTAWTKASVVKIAGKFTALVDNSRATDGYVSLRISAKATDGAAVTQTLIRAYAVR
ncbi:S8 family serine peptidase [Streptomyces sp. NPDC050392]|uniref:S8 family serine peptidase n=1 Tax=Streptomyces sp. NPDC050392 TaxID=3155782 RepID=UPI0034335551